MYKTPFKSAPSLHSQGLRQDLRKGGAKMAHEARKNFASKPRQLIKSRAPLIVRIA